MGYNPQISQKSEGLHITSSSLKVDGHMLLLSVSSDPLQELSYNSLYVKEDGNLYFKNKEGKITQLVNPNGAVSGTGDNSQIAVWDKTNVIIGASNLYWNSNDGNLSIKNSAADYDNYFCKKVEDNCKGFLGFYSASGILNNEGIGLGLNNNSSPTVFLNNSKVGINNTSPVYTLDVYDIDKAVVNINGNSAGLNLSNNNVPLIYLGNKNANDKLNTATLHSYNDFIINADGSVGISSKDAINIFIDANGKVGINNVSPQYNIDVAGNGRFSSTILVEEDASFNSSITVNKTLKLGNIANIDTNSNSDIKFTTNILSTLQPVFKMGANGDFIVGDASLTNSPSLKIVGNNAQVSVFNGEKLVSALGNVSSIIGGNYNHNTALWSAGNISFYNNGLSTPMMVAQDDKLGLGTAPSCRLDIAGTVNSNSFKTIADSNLKSNISPLKNVLHKFDKIQAVHFNWNDQYNTSRFKENNDKQIGLLAQELQKEFPELVEEFKQFIPETQETKTFLSIDYGKATAVLFEAIKELKNRTSMIVGPASIFYPVTGSGKVYLQSMFYNYATGAVESESFKWHAMFKGSIMGVSANEVSKGSISIQKNENDFIINIGNGLTQFEHGKFTFDVGDCIEIKYHWNERQTIKCQVHLILAQN